MLTDFASKFRVIPLTPFRELTRQEMFALVPLTNNPKFDKRDPDSFVKEPVGSHLRTWLESALIGDYTSIPESAMVVRLVDEYSFIYAWGTVWQSIKTSPSRDVGIYVRPDVRRVGLGTRVLNELRRCDDRVLVPREVWIHPWNEAGRCFFKAVLK